MYNEQLEGLIEMALVDGILSEKEKQVLFKKAEKLGVDLDEFEIVLDAKLFKKQQNIKANNTKTAAAPKSDKFGDIKKCPACGSMIQSFQIKCIDCGHEFSNIESSASIHRLFQLLINAEDSRKEDRSITGNPLIAIGRFYADAFSGLQGPKKVDRKKMDIISNFPVPNTKEDILEFLCLAIPKAKVVGNFLTKHSDDNKLPNMYAIVWKRKCEQIVMKARFSMKEDKGTLDEVNKYAAEIKIK